MNRWMVVAALAVAACGGAVQQPLQQKVPTTSAAPGRQVILGTFTGVADFAKGTLKIEMDPVGATDAGKAMSIPKTMLSVTNACTADPVTGQVTCACDAVIDPALCQFPWGVGDPVYPAQVDPIYAIGGTSGCGATAVTWGAAVNVAIADPNDTSNYSGVYVVVNFVSDTNMLPCNGVAAAGLPYDLGSQALTPSYAVYPVGSLSNSIYGPNPAVATLEWAFFHTATTSVTFRGYVVGVQVATDVGIDPIVGPLWPPAGPKEAPVFCGGVVASANHVVYGKNDPSFMPGLVIVTNADSAAPSFVETQRIYTCPAAVTQDSTGTAFWAGTPGYGLIDPGTLYLDGVPRLYAFDLSGNYMNNLDPFTGASDGTILPGSVFNVGPVAIAEDANSPSDSAWFVAYDDTLASPTPFYINHAKLTLGDPTAPIALGTPVALAAAPTSLAMGQGGAKAFVTQQAANQIQICDITNPGGVATATCNAPVSTVAAGCSQPAWMALAPTGDVWFTAYVGGETGYGSVCKITPAGLVSLVSATVFDPDGIAVGPDGNMWVTSNVTNPVSGAKEGWIYRFTVPSVSVPAENGVLGFFIGDYAVLPAATANNLWVISPFNGSLEPLLLRVGSLPWMPTPRPAP